MYPVQRCRSAHFTMNHWYLHVWITVIYCIRTTPIRICENQKKIAETKTKTKGSKITESNDEIEMKSKWEQENRKQKMMHYYVIGRVEYLHIHYTRVLPGLLQPHRQNSPTPCLVWSSDQLWLPVWGVLQPLRVLQPTQRYHQSQRQKRSGLCWPDFPPVQEPFLACHVQHSRHGVIQPLDLSQGRVHSAALQVLGGTLEHTRTGTHIHTLWSYKVRWLNAQMLRIFGFGWSWKGLIWGISVDWLLAR